MPRRSSWRSTGAAASWRRAGCWCASTPTAGTGWCRWSPRSGSSGSSSSSGWTTNLSSGAGPPPSPARSPSLAFPAPPCREQGGSPLPPHPLPPQLPSGSRPRSHSCPARRSSGPLGYFFHGSEAIGMPDVELTGFGSVAVLVTLPGRV